ncbi:endonuclease domain-containing protein [Sphingomonas montanisoli]|nr:endonuclease domain-containing protein [Sphingomonas montanisoli]
MSLPEVLLWQELRKQPRGSRFRRQHPAGPYSLDFFSARHRLAIEIDGEAHARGNQSARDAVRDRWLSKQGIKVLRIPAVEILSNLEAVLLHILVCVRGEYPSTAARSPSPSGGGSRSLQ